MKSSEAHLAILVPPTEAAHNRLELPLVVREQFFRRCFLNLELQCGFSKIFVCIV